MGALFERIRWNIWPRTETLKGTARALFYGIVGNLAALFLVAIITLTEPEAFGELRWPILGSSAAIYLLLAWLTFRGSRIAALVALALMVANVTLAAVNGQLPDHKEDVEVFLMPFVILLLLVNGVRGAFALQRRKAATSSTSVV